jgi:hypothetical protein
MKGYAVCGMRYAAFFKPQLPKGGLNSIQNWTRVRGLLRRFVPRNDRQFYLVRLNSQHEIL